MYKLIEPFGYHVWGDTIAEVWTSLFGAVLEHGSVTHDEGRKRLSLQNIVYHIQDYDLPDRKLEKFADMENINNLIYLTFEGEEMFDFDIKPSFSPGAMSYHQRIREGRMLEYVVKRLSDIPESKKGVMSFIHWDDYKAVLDTPFDDYLPCHTTIQFRLLKNENSYVMNVISHFRSIDAYQKSCGDFVVTAMLAQEVVDKLSSALEKDVVFGPMTGMITDAHIYEECIQDAKKTIKDYKK